MDQLSMFDNQETIELKYPKSYADMDDLFSQINEGETDEDAFAVNDISKGRTYYIYGTKVMEFSPKASAKGSDRLRVTGDLLIAIGQGPEDTDKSAWYLVKPMTAEQYNILIDTLKEKKQFLFENLGGESFACCNDFVRCSDAKECLHKGDRMYNHCTYRKNLEQGRIYYGRNKNAGDPESISDKPLESQDASTEQFLFNLDNVNDLSFSNDRYIVFDVETPNRHNDAISAIGIVIIENNTIINKLFTYVDPEEEFDPFNTNLTGIDAEKVKGSPTFPILWKNIKDVMASGMLVAHNASFDMSVLHKCLQRYNIEWLPYTHYLCTCKMSKDLLCLDNNRLDTVCNHFNIALNHHEAGSDAHACAEILLHYLSKGVDTVRYTTTHYFNHRYETKPLTIQHSQNTSQLLELKEVIKDIISDSVITEEETYQLQAWLDKNMFLAGQYPYDKICNTLTEVLRDGIIDASEKQTMLDLFGRLFDPLDSVCDCQDLSFEGKTFCLTGMFAYGSDSEVEKAIAAKGGIPVPSVTRKTDILIVGKLGSPLWSQGNYGSKVKKALEMQEKGIPIKIVKEESIL